MEKKKKSNTVFYQQFLKFKKIFFFFYFQFPTKKRQTFTIETLNMFKKNERNQKKNRNNFIKALKCFIIFQLTKST